MAQFPALPLWTDAYLADLHPRLSLEEHGCMILLLQFAWRSPECRLPDDDAYLARALGVAPKRWLTRLRPSMLRIWTVEGGWWVQKRLRREFAYVTRSRERLRERASLGGVAKSQNAKLLQARETRLLAARDESAPSSVQAGEPTATPLSKELAQQGLSLLPREPEPAPPSQAALGLASNARQATKIADELAELAGVDPAKVPSFAASSEILLWLDSGCDPDADIRPAVADVVASGKVAGRAPPRSWKYFRNAVTERRDQRKAGLPAKPVNGHADPDKPRMIAGAESRVQFKPVPDPSAHLSVADRAAIVARVKAKAGGRG